MAYNLIETYDDTFPRDPIFPRIIVTPDKIWLDDIVVSRHWRQFNSIFLTYNAYKWKDIKIWYICKYIYM